jgi:hypothetical protein
MYYDDLASYVALIRTETKVSILRYNGAASE